MSQADVFDNVRGQVDKLPYWPTPTNLPVLSHPNPNNQEKWLAICHITHTHTLIVQKHSPDRFISYYSKMLGNNFSAHDLSSGHFLRQDNSFDCFTIPARTHIHTIIINFCFYFHFSLDKDITGLEWCYKICWRKLEIFLRLNKNYAIE